MKVIQHHPRIDHLLGLYHVALGRDYEKYKNHVYRVFNLAMHLRQGTANEEDEEKLAIAAVLHDIGIWTNRTFDYLEPSIREMDEKLRMLEKMKWAEEIKLMIDMHHKRSVYTGPFEKNVEIFRKADWIDLTKGQVGHGVDRDFLYELY